MILFLLMPGLLMFDVLPQASPAAVPSVDKLSVGMSVREGGVCMRDVQSLRGFCEAVLKDCCAADLRLQGCKEEEQRREAAPRPPQQNLPDGSRHTQLSQMAIRFRLQKLCVGGPGEVVCRGSG